MPQLSASHKYNTEKTTDPFPAKCTVSTLINWASSVLQRHSIDAPRLDAEIILSYMLVCRRIDLYVHPDKQIEDSIAEGFKKAILKRADRVPLQYITNHAEFMSIDFYVDERVLIPRPETELLVETVINRLQMVPERTQTTIVDVGVGSGNIAVTLAKKVNNARIFATDISSDALDVAMINAQRHNVLDKITFLRGDIFAPLEGCGIKAKIDCIVSNPPYVSSDEFNKLQEEVRNHEPYVALISGQDGLQMFRRIVTDAHTWLKPGGFVVFEVGETQARKVARLMEASKRFGKAEFIKDYQRINRIVVAQLEGNCGKNSY